MAWTISHKKSWWHDNHLDYCSISRWVLCMHKRQHTFYNANVNLVYHFQTWEGVKITLASLFVDLWLLSVHYWSISRLDKAVSLIRGQNHSRFSYLTRFLRPGYNNKEIWHATIILFPLFFDTVVSLVDGWNHVPWFYVTININSDIMGIAR
jgi:hypothetical protein